jgi:predicted enzyme related to lactoylglutathione lyase
MTNPHGSFIWYELISPDPDASKAFYDAVVGWDIEPAPAGEMDYRMIRRADGGNNGGVMRLTEEMRGHGAHPTWLGYLGVDDVDRAVTAVAESGGKSLMPAWDIDGIGRIAMVTDPQGCPFYVMKPVPPEATPDAASDVFSPDQIGRVGWNELATPDQDAALHFYARLFGIVEAGRMPMGEMGDYVFIKHHDVPVGAVMRQQPGQPAGWMFVFRVASVAASATAIADGGGTIVRAPHQVPNDDWLVIAIDPHGARFAAVGAK